MAATAKTYIIGTDGSGLRQLPAIQGEPVGLVRGPDQKSVYVGIRPQAEATADIWKWNVDDSKVEKFTENCGWLNDADPGGQYLFGVLTFGDKVGIYEVSISDRKCIPLLPGVVTTGVSFAPDGKSFLYAVASRGEATIYRQLWKNGKLLGTPQVALKLPFAFPLA